MASLSPFFNLQFFDNSGVVCALGRLHTYDSGTTTPKQTWQDQAGATTHALPTAGVALSGIQLDAAGRVPGTGAMWLGTGEYTFHLYTAAGTLVKTWDDVGGAGVDTLATLASTASVGVGAGLSGFAYALNYAAGTLGGVVKTLGIDVTQPPYSADKTGVATCTAAVQSAITDNPGVPIRMPAGTYRFDTGLSFITTSANVFTPGVHIYGDGPGLTIIDWRGASDDWLDIDTNTASKFQLFGVIRDLKITCLSGTPAASNGIRLRRAFNYLLENIWITGLTGDAVKLVMNAGDADGSNMVTLRRCRLENCGGWGFNHDVTGAYNETSFLRLEHVFIQACGTNSATVPPPSGGMRWKGQILEIQGGAYGLNENVALYVQGGSGLANTVDIVGTAFENNKKRHVYCNGIDGFKTRSIQFYSNNSYIATNGIEFDGATYAVRGVEMNGTIVRATSSNNPYTAFKISGANAALDTCRVRGTIWTDFDNTGQTRFDGWQFDEIPIQCELVVVSSTSVVLRPSQVIGRGNAMPLRLRGTSSTSGEWVAVQIQNVGVGISNASLANSTRYYAYLYDNSGVRALELSTTTYTTDTATGYAVKTGDATRLYLGSVITDGAAAFLTTTTGWLNPTLIANTQLGAPAYIWRANGGQLRIASTAPTSDTDGTIVGLQS